MDNMIGSSVIVQQDIHWVPPKCGEVTLNCDASVTDMGQHVVALLGKWMMFLFVILLLKLGNVLF